MKDLRLPSIARWQDRSGRVHFRGGGRFFVPSAQDKVRLCVVATTAYGWDHVSVSRTDRCPWWNEMEQIKRLFFKETETAVQFHVPPVDHVSHHPYCLHLWRPQGRKLPRPPTELIAPRRRR